MPAEKKERHGGGEVEYVWKQGMESAEEIPSKILPLTILFLCRQSVFSAGKGRTRRMFSEKQRDVFNHMKTSTLVPFPKSLVKRERAAYRENLSESAEISANIKA